MVTAHTSAGSLLAFDIAIICLLGMESVKDVVGTCSNNVASL